VHAELTSATPAGGREENALGSYLRAIQTRAPFVAVVTLVAILGAIVFLVASTPTYEATARLLVNPLPQDDRNFLGVNLLRDSGDPTRTVQTAAAVVESRPAADLAARRLGAGWTGDTVLEAITVRPQGESAVLAVTAEADDQPLAARLANEFVRAVLDVRRQTLRGEVTELLRQLRPRDRAERASPDLAERLNQLEAVRDGTDPTLSLAERATPPDSRSGPPPWLVIALALIAGLAVGAAGAVAMEALDRRVRDEDDLGELYPLPALARVPLLPEEALEATGAMPLSPPPAIAEALRTLAVQLEQTPKAHRAVMVTSPSRGDGKTSVAVALAVTLARAGHGVTLLDLDVRNPGISSLLEVPAQEGGSLLPADDDLPAHLFTTPEVPGLSVMPIRRTDDDPAPLDELVRRLPDLVAAAKAHDDYVIVDTPPLGEVSDALRIAGQIDDIVVVVRPGHTDRADLARLRELLERTGHRPAGFVVIVEQPEPLGGYGRDGTGSHAPAGAPSGLARSPS
jgi:Mrp family chromosome partitioning ATPase/capsular polysaccharide biosynthesis protein